MTQQSKHSPNPHEVPSHHADALIPLDCAYDAHSATYRLRSVRQSRITIDIPADAALRPATDGRLAFFCRLYGLFGRLGPLIIRLVALVLNRLRADTVPEALVLLSTYPRLFDAAYYRSQLRTPVGDALLHYLTVGDAHNVCPNPLFDPAVYRRYNMLPSEAQANTLVHYMRGTWHGSGVTSYFFHSRWYRDQNSDVARTGYNPLAHYLLIGFREHRDPSPVFDLSNYWARTPQLSRLAEPVEHYIAGGYERYPHADELLNPLSDMPFPYPVAREFTHFAAQAGSPLTAAERTTQAAVIRQRMAACAAIQAPTPVVTIVIPVYNQLKYTITAVESILVSRVRVPFEIIVVDDRSTDETAAFFADLAPIRCITQAQNHGFIAACNRGASEARGEFVVFLNNDVYVLPGWLDTLYATFADQSNVGLVGSQLLYPDGFLQEAGGIIWANGQGWNYGRGEYPMLPHYTYLRDVDYCSGASIMLRTALFRSVGMFPTAFMPAYYEDADLAMAVKAAGYRVVYQPGSMVVHFEGVSSGRDVASGVKAYQTRNHALFTEKWAAALEGRRAYGDDPRRAAEQSRNGRILFADATYPTPDQDAGSAVADGWMRIFLRLGYHVTFVGVDNFTAVPKYTKRLEQLGVYCPRRPYAADLGSYIAQHAGSYVVNVVIRYDRAQKLYAHLDAAGDTSPRIFMPCDLHYLREFRRANLDGSIPSVLQSFKTKYEEYSVMVDAALVCVHSDAERDEINATLPSVPVEVTPIMYDVPGRTTDYTNRADVLFVGGFRHPPNVDGLLFFATEVWPLVQAALPGIVLHVVGSNTTPEIAALAGPTITIHGFVEDLNPLLDHARLSIAPLRYGAGVKGKVTMSMCNGLPVVGTTIAFEGMALRDGVEMLCADTAAAMAAHIIRAYTDEALWYQLSDQSVARARREYSLEANIPQLEQFIATVTTGIDGTTEA